MNLRTYDHPSYSKISIQPFRARKNKYMYALLDKEKKTTYYDAPKRYKDNWTQIDMHTGFKGKCKILHFGCQ